MGTGTISEAVQDGKEGAQMTCRSPSGICDQSTCVIAGQCQWSPAAHWTGQAGQEYHARQTVTLEANVEFFQRALTRSDATSMIELGCGAGLNRDALWEWDENVAYHGIDIDGKSIGTAATHAAAWSVHDVATPWIDWTPLPLSVGFDLTFTKGCLIHIEPAKLPIVYENLYSMSGSEIMIAEYYSPNPVEIEYRGRTGLLWKRDFAGEMLKAYPDLRLVDYGFHSRHDEFPQDDITWFLMRKRA